MFIAFVATLVTTANVYAFKRAVTLGRLSDTGRALLAVVLAAGAASFLLARVAPMALRELLGTLGATVELGVLIGAIVLLLVDIAHAPFWFATRRRAAPSPQPRGVGDAPQAQLTRREMIHQTASGLALAFGGASAAYGVVLGRHDFRVEEVPVPIPGLPRELDGLTLVQLSDIHFGTYIGDDEIAEAARLVRQARPDVIVLTGDLVDHDTAFAPMLGRLVRRLAPIARHGVVAIPGNHDYYTGVETVLRTLDQAGARVLRNDGMVIDGARGTSSRGVALLGVDDVWAGRDGLSDGPDLAKAIAAVPSDLPRVLLCHNPVFFKDSKQHVALQLSGHTHGGQVKIGVQPAGWVLPHGYVQGLYPEDGSLLYVNRGFGTAGPPVRIGVPPEITKIVLMSA